MFDYVCRETLKGADALNVYAGAVPGMGDIAEIAPLFWADHCLECSPPACYASCELFEANEIGRCKRVDFIETGTVNGFDFPVTHLRFRKWSKLRCAYNNCLAFPAWRFLKDYRRHEAGVALAKKIDAPSRLLPGKVRFPLSRLIHHRYIEEYRSDTKSGEPARELCFAFYSPNGKGCKLLLDSYGFDEMLLTRNVLEISEGLNAWRVPTDKLSRGGAPVYALEIFPANNEPLELYILFSDLVTFRPKPLFAGAVSSGKKPAKKVKCVAWDLDNTLWDGIIGEDGLDGVTIRPNVAETIKALDRRGILNTICSKNDEALALAGLDRFGLREYFLYPKINWKPKSGNLLEISRLLNINIDTFAFVDDSAFERAEVQNTLGCVRVFADTEVDSLPEREEFQVPVTADSVKRRAFYMSEAQRQEALSESESGDYEAFIRSCDFRIDVAPCKTDEDVDRCHELLMRTNQLNASTNRIPRDEFRAIVSDPGKLVLRIKCDDKYGEYGTVGCLILEKKADALVCTDFVISCRAARKKVESALIMHLMRHYGLPMEIVYKPSERNHVLKDEFLSVGAQYDEPGALMRFTPETIRDHDWAAVTDSTELPTL